MSMQAPLFDAAGKSQGMIDLPENIFGADGSRYSLHEVIVGLRRNQRRGTSATKTRGLVSGGGRKPWKQKGTGNARSGSNRSPLWRKGGIIFGPMPRCHRVNLDDSKKQLALLTALAEKAKAGQISVIESPKFEKAKTSKAAGLLDKAGRAKRTLVVVDQYDPLAQRAMRNIAGVEIAHVSQINAWTLMQAHKIIFSKAALDAISGRVSVG